MCMWWWRVGWCVCGGGEKNGMLVAVEEKSVCERWLKDEGRCVSVGGRMRVSVLVVVVE